jgi:hypothetical protein
MSADWDFRGSPTEVMFKYLHVPLRLEELDHVPQHSSKPGASLDWYSGSPRSNLGRRFSSALRVFIRFCPSE